MEVESCFTIHLANQAKIEIMVTHEEDDKVTAKLVEHIEEIILTAVKDTTNPLRYGKNEASNGI